MPAEAARAWARKRWPDIPLKPEGWNSFVAAAIDRYYRINYPDGEKWCVICIHRNEKSWCLFVRRFCDDPLATATKFKRIRERDEDKEYALNWFPDEVAAGLVMYMTVSDPYENYSTYSGESVVMLRPVKPPQKS